MAVPPEPNTNRLCQAFRESLECGHDPQRYPSDHWLNCQSCQDFLCSSKWLKSSTAPAAVTRSAMFTQRVVKLAIQEKRRQAQRKTASLIMAGIGCVILLGWPNWTGDGDGTTGQTTVKDHSVAVALESPARELVPVNEEKRPPMSSPAVLKWDAVELASDWQHHQNSRSDTPESAIDTIAAMPDMVQMGLEPVAKTARRAVHLFLRDTGWTETSY